MNPSYRSCHTLTRRTAGNFYPAFLVLPRRERRAMEALYAFLRVSDDLADEPGPTDEKLMRTQQWRAALDAALDGRPSHPSHPAIVDTVRRCGIPLRYLHDVLDGVESDLRPVAIQTFDELHAYCYRVAGAVGLACIHVWGFVGDRAAEFAESAGIAFQITNILRDLGEDRANGRIYLPSDDCVRFGSAPESWREDDPAFREMMAFQVARAQGIYDEAFALLPKEDRRAQRPGLMMAAIYRAVLGEIERDKFNVLTQRISLTPLRKLWLAWKTYVRG